MKLGNYNGGKGNLFRRLINLQPQHSMYAEPFIGGGAVFLKKRPAAVSVGLDMDGAVIAAWVEWLEGIAKNGGASVTSHMTVQAGTAISGGRIQRPLDVVLPGCTAISGGTRFNFIHGCGIRWLETAVLPDDALIYCDPPYLFETRASQRPLYNHEMTVADHVRLLDAVLALDCMVMVSGYWSELYAEKLGGWETAVFDAYTRSGRKTEEYVWMNYERPERLHDYRYLGNDYRERERIKRKATRWVKGLQRLPRLERLAILAAMEVAGL